MTEPPEPRIHAFSSMEEVFGWMADNEAQAIRDTLDEQWQIDWGARVFRIVNNLAIYGQVYTEAQFLELEGLLVNGELVEADLDDEAQYELAQLRDAHARGYRYGRWFSEVVPDGEYGSAHVVNLWPISVAEFEEARAREWLHPTLVFKVGQRVGDALMKREAKRTEKGEGDT